MRKSFLFIIITLFSFTFSEVDCLGQKDGYGICLSYENIDPDTGYLEIHYNSLYDIARFQMKSLVVNRLDFLQIVTEGKHKVFKERVTPSSFCMPGRTDFNISIPSDS